MIELTRQFGRYGYRRVAALLRDAGWQVNDKRVERLWRREGLKVPMKQSKKGRLWLNPSRDITSQCPVGQWMGHVSDCVQSIATMSGRMTLCITELTMVGSSER
jgi:transposase InsO family protein